MEDETLSRVLVDLEDYRSRRTIIVEDVKAIYYDEGHVIFVQDTNDRPRFNLRNVLKFTVIKHED